MADTCTVVTETDADSGEADDSRNWMYMYSLKSTAYGVVSFDAHRLLAGTCGSHAANMQDRAPWNRPTGLPPPPRARNTDLARLYSAWTLASDLN